MSETQEIRETVEMMMAKDFERMEAIISKNKHLREPYWICIFKKPCKFEYQGNPTFMTHLKAYTTRPPSQVGVMYFKVDNVKGILEEDEINLPDVPIDMEALHYLGAKPREAPCVLTSKLSDAYIHTTKR